MLRRCTQRNGYACGNCKGDWNSVKGEYFGIKRDGVNGVGDIFVFFRGRSRVSLATSKAIRSRKRSIDRTRSSVFCIVRNRRLLRSTTLLVEGNFNDYGSVLRNSLWSFACVPTLHELPSSRFERTRNPNRTFHRTRLAAR